MPEQQRLFRRLGLHPGTDIDAYAGAALDEIDLDEARRSLDALYNHYLIAGPARGRYRLRDLMREHASTLAAADPPADRAAATGRLLGFYLHAARSADRHLSRRPHARATSQAGVTPAVLPDLTRQRDAMAWMDRERLNLHAIVDHAVRHGRSEYAIAIPCAMQGFLRFNGHWDEAIALHSAALDAALRRATGTVPLAPSPISATPGSPQGTTPQRGADLAAATELYRDLDDRRLGEARSRTEQGAVLYLSGEYRAAAACLEQALRLAREHADQLGEANVRKRLASVQLVTGDYPSSDRRADQGAEAVP